MSSLLQTIARRGAFFLFATLEIGCIYLVIKYNSSQQEVANSSWLLYSGRLMEEREQIKEYLKLDQLNQQLREENAKLLSRMPNAFYTEKVVIDSVQNDSLRQRYTIIAAEIINKSPLSGNITYVLNRGYIHGVEPHQGVFNQEGVVGIVAQVSPRHARVMSLMHRDMRLSAGLRAKAYFGTLRWVGGDTRYATLSAIPEYAPVATGDTVETTGYSNIFPTGIAIGTVHEIQPISGENTYNIKVKLFNDFFNVNHAYIVRDLLKEDLEQLDKQPQ